MLAVQWRTVFQPVLFKTKASFADGGKDAFFIFSVPEHRKPSQDRSGHEFHAGVILQYFEALKRASDKENGVEDSFEIAACLDSGAIIERGTNYHENSKKQRCPGDH